MTATPYGIFYDTMIHDFDMARWLMDDEPVEIVARTACMLDENENPHRDPDTAMVVLRMAGGGLVHVNSSFRAVYGYDQRIEVFGATGMLISDNHRATTVERFGKDGVRRDPLLHFFLDRYAESYRLESPLRCSFGITRAQPPGGMCCRRSTVSVFTAGVTCHAAASRRRICRVPTTTRIRTTARIISTISTDAYAVA